MGINSSLPAADHIGHGASGIDIEDVLGQGVARGAIMVCTAVVHHSSDMVSQSLPITGGSAQGVGVATPLTFWVLFLVLYSYCF